MSEVKKGKPQNFSQQTLDRLSERFTTMNLETSREGEANGRYIETKYLFYNLTTKEELIETPYNFSHITGLDRSRVSKLFKGKIHHYKRWVCSCLLQSY